MPLLEAVEVDVTCVSPALARGHLQAKLAGFRENHGKHSSTLKYMHAYPGGGVEV